MGITDLCENAHFTYNILQYTCFNCTCYTCSYDKCVWDLSQHNKLSDIQYARFQILPVDLYFGLFLVSWFPHHDTHKENKCLLPMSSTHLPPLENKRQLLYYTPHPLENKRQLPYYLSSYFWPICPVKQESVYKKLEFIDRTCFDATRTGFYWLRHNVYDLATTVVQRSASRLILALSTYLFCVIIAYHMLTPHCMAYCNHRLRHRQSNASRNAGNFYSIGLHDLKALQIANTILSLKVKSICTKRKFFWKYV